MHIRSHIFQCETKRNSINFHWSPQNYDQIRERGNTAKNPTERKREKEASRGGYLPLVILERGVGVATLFFENHLVAPTGTGVRFRARYDFLHRRLSRNAIALTGTTCAWTVYSCSCRRMFECARVFLRDRGDDKPLNRTAAPRFFSVYVCVCDGR